MISLGIGLELPEKHLRLTQGTELKVSSDGRLALRELLALSIYADVGEHPPIRYFLR